MLQSFPLQCNTLLASIDNSYSTVLTVKFDLFDVKPHLPYHVAFQTEVFHGDKTIGHIENTPQHSHLHHRDLP